MAILETASATLPRGGGGGATGRGNGFTRNLSLITLTFQNSALILVMHYSRVMPPLGDHRYFTSTAVFINELIKLAVSLTVAMYETSKTLAPSTPATVLFEQIYNVVFGGDGWKLAVPAVFYTLQNLLQYVAVGNLDPVHFQVLYQLKILTTAVFSVVLLHRQLAFMRWVSLIVLTIGVSIVSLPSTDSAIDSVLLHGMPDHFFPRSQHELGQAPDADIDAGAHLSRRSATYEGIDNDQPVPDLTMNYSAGLTAVLVAATVSGLAGVYFEKILKESNSHTGLWMRNVQISFYSVLAAFFGGVVWQDGAGIREHGFFEGYNSVVWAAILLQAAGGLLASLVIRDADNIVKNFATSISIIISFLVSVWMFDFAVSFAFITGTSLVLLATYLYSLPDRSLNRRPPPINIVGFEKPAIERTFTPGSTPRTVSARLLNTDPFDAKGLGKSTSRPGSPMQLRQASRGQYEKTDEVN